MSAPASSSATPNPPQAEHPAADTSATAKTAPTDASSTAKTPPATKPASATKTTKAAKTSKNSKTIHGSRNLAILGLISISLAVISTAISLYIYHATGDIYLDRSRPGFISEDEDLEEDTTGSTTYSFPAEGEITPETLEQYLDELDQVIDEIDATSDAFGPGPLSDESLGITVDSANSSDEPAAPAE